MVTFRWVAVVVVLVSAVQPVLADDREKLVGTWRVISFETEYQQTGAREPILGKNPTGYVIYTRDGRKMVLITAEGRNAATTDQDRAGLWRSMVAYTGTYRVEGDSYIVKVDVSSMPTVVGTERALLFRVAGDRLESIQKEWTDAPLNPERGKIRTIVTCERVK